jgi:recombination protein RecT
MNTELATTQSTLTTFLQGDKIKAKFEEMLGKNSAAFLSSVLTIINGSDALKKASKESVYTASLMAATLNLAINPNLGFAYIVPYKGNASFQMGWKGYVQLAQRTGLFLTIGAREIYEGQLIEDNSFEGFSFSWKAKTSDKIVGYAANFKLLNGFEKTLYMTSEEITAHAKKYSQSFKSGYGVWKDNLDAMAKKTVIKLLLSKYAPLSIDMQMANIADAAVIRSDNFDNPDTIDVEYVDNQTLSIDEQQKIQDDKQISDHIENSKTKEELSEVDGLVDKHGLRDAYEYKLQILTPSKK